MEKRKKKAKCMQNLKTLALIEAEKSVTEIFIGEKEKWINIIKEWSAGEGWFSLTQYNKLIPNICTIFQNPRFSSSWEIFDEKKVYTHMLLLKRQKLYTPYILRIPGV